MGVTSSGTEDTVGTAVVNGRVEVSLAAAPGTEKLVIALSCRGRRFETTLEGSGASDLVTRAFFLRDAVTGRPVRNAAVFAPGDSVPAMGSAPFAF